MAKIINDNLPIPVYEWILAVNSSYSKGDSDISVTELINPPRVRMLKKLHDAEIVINASTLLNVSIGHAVHKGIQDATKTGISERRLSIVRDGWKISGGMDHYLDGVLSDWKTCNKWKTVLCNNGIIDEFEKQLNVYAQILRENKEPVSNAKIFAIFKDWNRSEFRSYLDKKKIFIPNKKSGYPEKEWLYFDLRLWPEDVASNYIDKRIALHKGPMPLCTASEIWGGKRCKEYCEVNKWCEQHLKQKQTGLMEK